MTLNIFDGLTNDECELISKSKSNENSQFLKVEAVDYDDLKNYENITIYVGLSLNFVSKKLIEFFERLIAKNLKKSQIELIFIEKLGETAKIAIDWVNSLNQNFGFNLKIKSEISRENLSYDLAFISESVKSQTKPKSENQVTIYTDGACSGNPGAGGWGAILFHGNHKKEISGFDPETTNNKMEITAVIKALELLKAPCEVELYSDSAYVVNAINLGWLENWKANSWKGSDKKPVKNIEYWERLDKLMQIHTVKFIKVKGHADNEFNNRCDELATGEIAKNANL